MKCCESFCFEDLVRFPPDWPAGSEALLAKMIMDSSEEEEEEETSVQEPIDWAAEAAKTAARSLAKSASQSYVTSLVPRCAEAAKDPSIQEKQQKALDALVARHPEMAQKKAAPPAPAAPAASPAPAVAAAPAVAPATAPASPKKGASFKETSPAPAPAPATPSPKRAEPKASPKASPKARPKAPPSPARAPPKKVRARKAVEASRAGDGEAQLEADETMASTVNTAVSLSYDKAATQMDMTMTPKRRSPKAMSASMTQLPSTRGPIETSGCQREMFLHSLSKHGSMPLLSFVPRRDTNLWGSNSNPAPGTYPTMDESRTSKYMAPRQVSFGFTKRGGRGDGRGAEPGPGAHSITNFERFRFAEPVRHSFGGAPRGRPNPIRRVRSSHGSGVSRE
ncbi:unnamed protein product [Effrenium voratum]|nr:unnamed protein product [Effrenium voratum]